MAGYGVVTKRFQLSECFSNNFMILLLSCICDLFITWIWIWDIRRYSFSACVEKNCSGKKVKWQDSRSERKRPDEEPGRRVTSEKARQFEYKSAKYTGF